MKPVAQFHLLQPVEFQLRTVTESDLELLRTWKNADRQYFFHKDVITPEQQRTWFTRFSLNVHDHMFLAEAAGIPIGCVGVRWLSDGVDIYNVILGEKERRVAGLMSVSLQAVGAFAAFMYPAQPIFVRVLTINPAVSWYERNGFQLLERKDDHVLMQLKKPSPGPYPCRLSLSLPLAHSRQ